MEKKLFIKCIDSIQNQLKYDIEFSEQLGKAFPSVFTPMLLPDNSILLNSFIEILEYNMNDKKNDKDGYSWITWFCYETDFGNNKDLIEIRDTDNTIIKIETAEDLYDFLKNK